MAYIEGIARGETEMTSIINACTFKPSDEQPAHNFWIEGTVEVTLGKETRRVKAHKSTRDNTITAFGMTGKYQTGAKAWAASVQQRIDPRTGQPWDNVSFGRDERAGRCIKTNALHFA